MSPDRFERAHERVCRVVLVQESSVKILYISNGFPPERWAGTEVYTAALATEFQRRGASVQVLCAGTWEHGESHYNGHVDESDHGVSVRRLNLNWTKAPAPFTYLFENPTVAAQVARFLDEWRPDIVHVTSCETLSASVLAVVKDRGLPLALSLTDFWFICPRIQLLTSNNTNCDGHTTTWECTTCLGRHSKAYRWTRSLLPESATEHVLSAVSRVDLMTRLPGLRGMFGDMDRRRQYLMRAITWPDVRMTASPFVKKMYASNGVSVPIDVRPYGNDLSWLAQSGGKKPSQVLRLGYVGQIAWFKGVHVLLEAIRQLNADLASRFTLTIHGKLEQFPDYGEDLRELATALPNVSFAGVYRRDNMAAVFDAIDVLVVPSLWYDFPIALQEALASGAPAVASDLGGMAEAIVHERNGLLFPPGDASALAMQLRRLIESPELVERLRQGIGSVMTVQQDADGLDTIYRQLIERQAQVLQPV